MVHASRSQRQRNWRIESKVLRTNGGCHEYRLAGTYPGRFITSSENVSEGVLPPSSAQWIHFRWRLQRLTLNRYARVSDTQAGLSIRTNSLGMFALARELGGSDAMVNAMGMY